jgi:hypothetical protein
VAFSGSTGAPGGLTGAASQARPKKGRRPVHVA